MDESVSDPASLGTAAQQPVTGQVLLAAFQFVPQSLGRIFIMVQMHLHLRRRLTGKYR